LALVYLLDAQTLERRISLWDPFVPLFPPERFFPSCLDRKQAPEVVRLSPGDLKNRNRVNERLLAAKTQVNRAIALDPTDPYSYYLLSIAQHGLGENQLALGSIKRLLELMNSETQDQAIGSKMSDRVPMLLKAYNALSFYYHVIGDNRQALEA